MPVSRHDPLATGQVIAIRSCQSGNVGVVNEAGGGARPATLFMHVRAVRWSRSISGRFGIAEHVPWKSRRRQALIVPAASGRCFPKEGVA